MENKRELEIAIVGIKITILAMALNLAMTALSRSNLDFFPNIRFIANLIILDLAVILVYIGFKINPKRA